MGAFIHLLPIFYVLLSTVPNCSLMRDSADGIVKVNHDANDTFTKLHHGCVYVCAGEPSASQILKAALRDAFIPHKDDKFLFHGPGGVGKSSLIAMFLGKRRYLIRVSTAVANRPLTLCLPV